MTSEARKPWWRRWWTIVGVLLIAFALVRHFYVVPKVESVLRKAFVQNELNVIAASVALYDLEYARLPQLNRAPKWEAKDYLGDTRSEVFWILAGANVNELNPRERKFYLPFEAHPLWKGVESLEGGKPELLDPWGRAIQIVIDGNEDGIVHHPDSGVEYQRDILVVSQGEDAGSAEDDLVSGDIRSGDFDLQALRSRSDSPIY